MPVSAYSIESVNNQSDTKQELPMYQTEQNPTYQSHMLKKNLNKVCLPKQTI